MFARDLVTVAIALAVFIAAMALSFDVGGGTGLAIIFGGASFPLSWQYHGVTIHMDIDATDSDSSILLTRLLVALDRWHDHQIADDHQIDEVAIR